MFGCSQNQEDDYEAVSCTATENDVIDVGAPVAVDFNVTGVNMTGTIAASSCAGLPQGSSASSTVSALRVGNALTLTDSNANVFTTTITGTTLDQTTDSDSAGGCSIAVVYTGSLDTGLNKITLTMQFTVTQTAEGACQGIMSVGAADAAIAQLLSRASFNSN